MRSDVDRSFRNACHDGRRPASIATSVVSRIGEPGHLRINRNREETRERDAVHAIERGDSEPCRAEPDGAGAQGEHGGLADVLRHQPAAAGAKCRMHRHLPGTAGGTHDQQAGDVGRGNQQQRDDGDNKNS